MTAKIKLNAASGGGSVSLEAPTSTTGNANVELKLPVADGSNGQALTTNGSGQLAFSSVSGTTINNNANNRVITGSGTANTLEGESGLTFDGNTMNLTSGSGDARLTLIGTEGNDARISLVCDDGDDHIDQYNIRSDATDNSLTFDQFESGSFVERMRINNGGNVCIGRASDSLNGATFMVEAPNDNVGYFYHTGSGNNYTLMVRNDRASGSTQATQVIFIATGNTAVGDIRSTGSSTAYNTSSDYRLKENVTPITDGITRLKTLKPSRFNFKVDKDTIVDGFLAHEVSSTVPEAISGTKDEVALEDNEKTGVKKGDPIYQGIDQAKLVPLLTAALQEAVAKIEVLEAKVAALEAA